MSTPQNRQGGILILLRRGWTFFARVIGWCTTHLLLSLFYVLLGVPAIALKIAALFSPRRPAEEGSYWKDKEQPPSTLDRARHQF